MHDCAIIVEASVINFVVQKAGLTHVFAVTVEQ